MKKFLVTLGLLSLTVVLAACEAQDEVTEETDSVVVEEETMEPAVEVQGETTEVTEEEVTEETTTEETAS